MYSDSKLYKGMFFTAQGLAVEAEWLYEYEKSREFASSWKAQEEVHISAKYCT